VRVSQPGRKRLAPVAPYRDRQERCSGDADRCALPPAGSAGVSGPRAARLHRQPSRAAVGRHTTWRARPGSATGPVARPAPSDLASLSSVSNLLRQALAITAEPTAGATGRLQLAAAPLRADLLQSLPAPRRCQLDDAGISLERQIACHSASRRRPLKGKQLQAGVFQPCRHSGRTLNGNPPPTARCRGIARL